MFCMIMKNDAKLLFYDKNCKIINMGRKCIRNIIMEIINVIPSTKDVLYLKLNNFKLFGRGKTSILGKQSCFQH